MRRTTVMLEEELYRAMKRKAVDRGRSMRGLIEEALQSYLGLRRTRSSQALPHFGVYPAGVRSSWSRADLYDEHLRRTV